MATGRPLEETGPPLRAHFVLVPFMAQGHMIPMADLGFLLASRGALVSLITTPMNAERLQPSVDHHRHLPIRLVPLPFPSSETGLPPGCENLDTLSDGELVLLFINSPPVLDAPLRLFLRNNPSPLPTCLISDFCHSWTRHVARDLGIRRYVFYSVCCFTLTCHRMLQPFYEGGGAPDASKPFVVPGLEHHQVVVTRDQAPGFFSSDAVQELRRSVEEADTTSDGIIVNTFEEMEPTYVESFRKNTGRKVWAVGPVSLHHRESRSKATRGWSSTIGEETLMSWLDSKEPRSVVYCCLGTLTIIRTEQMKETGLGLEASGSCFIWVMRKPSEEVDTWLQDGGFEERNRAKGLIIRGWAPQTMILSHPSVGAFVTHCGWNSSMEGVAAGLPLVTWPQFGDQFLNEWMLVNVVRTAVAVGATQPNMWWKNEEAEVVGRGKVAVAVRKVMGGGAEAEAEERRKRAREIGDKAEEVTSEEGSSRRNLTALIEEVVRLG